ncbi:GSCOCG00011651001-RA-CDS, partial [Cotesia congregata]
DENDRRPFVNVQIGGRTIKALLDTGASVTCIKEVDERNWVYGLGARVRPTNKKTAAVADGSVMAIHALVTLPLVINDEMRPVEVRVIPKLNYDMILGMDAIAAFEICYDGQTGRWWTKRTDDLYDWNSKAYLDGRDVAAIVEITPEQQNALDELLTRKLPSVKYTGETTFTNLMTHTIDVQGHDPIRQRNYPTSQIIESEMRRQVDDLLAAGIIEPSTSAWCNPVIMVKKATGEYRMCLDFRRLNAISKPCAYPLPLMTWILDQLSGAKFISKIDLKHAYHQVKLDPASREYTAFSVPGRCMFQYVGMPFGLAGAPPHFQQLIDTMLERRRGLRVFGYLDDLIVVTETFEEHADALNEVFDALNEANLKINVDKCEFCTDEVRYLGYRVNEQGLLVDPDRVKSMLDFPRPRNMKQVRRFLGMASWYRRFIPDFATIAEPLTRLTSKKVRWTWTAEQDASFEALKVALATAPVLSCPDFSKTFVLQTDASATGLGAVLTQEHEGGREKVVAYASRIMNKAERNYSATERECLAVLWACEHFRRYLEGYRFKVITDHSSLRWL